VLRRKSVIQEAIPYAPALSKQCPIERNIMKDGAIAEIPEPGGLHHRYERIAA